jgi:hypothetical protein
MPDTIRTRAALLALLGDNTTEDISPQDMRDVLVTLHGVYGDLLITAGAAAQGSISTTPAKVTGWDTDGLSAGTTPDHATDNDISVGSDGVYDVRFSLSVSAATASALFRLEVYKNGVATGIAAEIVTNATPDRFVVAGGGLLSCSANDNIELYVVSDGAARTMTPTEGQLVVHRIA